MEFVKRWFRRHFSDPQVVTLVLVLGAGIAIVLSVGRILAPVIAAIVVAYILESPVALLRKRGAPHWAAVIAVFVGFVALILFGLLTLLPLLEEQVTQLVRMMPSMVTRLQELLLDLPERFPELFDRDQIQIMSNALRSEILTLGQTALVFSADRIISNLFAVFIYLFLVPLMVFFFLKDKDAILGWVTRFLPADRGLAVRVWNDVDEKIGAYARGKVYEICIIGIASWIAFEAIGLEFAGLLGSLSGLSVLVPYIGVAAVGFPIGFVALFQFGLTGETAGVLSAYAVIQVLDGNVLAPLLISEVVNLHPVAVVTAVLLFGGIWGLWGVFFAIPLATLAVAVLNAWPTPSDSPQI